MTRDKTVLVLATLVALLPALLGVAATPARSQQGADPEQQLRTAVAATLQVNVHLRGVPVVYPSRAYYNPYLRDSFWTAQALGNRDFALRVLAAFAAAERGDGDPPTMFVNAYRYPVYHDDESSALLLIWAWRNAVLYGVTPPRAQLQHALSYLLRRTVDGYLVNPPGRFGGWWDAYRLPASDTLAYNQGLYGVALQCARRLGLPLPAHAIARAELAYRALYDARLGYLRLSRRIPASDASALSGEFLSLWLFGHAMLTDAIVLATLHHLPPFGAGFRVVVLPGQHDPYSTGFPDSTAMGVRGDYQNGGSWLLYDALSIAAAGLHGQHDALPRLRARLALEFRQGVALHEYLRTDPALPYYGAEPPYRDGFSWDTFVLVIYNVLHDHAPST